MRAAAVRAAGALTAPTVLLAGCADDQAAAPRETAPATSGLPADYEVPTIAEPIDPGRFVTDPCALLTEEERADLELPDAEREERFGTVECLLHPAGDQVTTVQLKLMTDRGLTELVDGCQGEYAAASCASWSPTTIERYPAILDTGGLCRIMTGVAERVVLLVVTLTEPECRRATDLTTTALATLRETV